MAPLPTTRLSSRMGEEANVPPGAVPLKSQQWITVWADALAEKARINAESMRFFKGTWIKKCRLEFIVQMTEIRFDNLPFKN